MQKTYVTKLKDIKRHWHLIDLKGKILGRVGTEISQLLMGKNKVYYTSHLDCGDFVVCINAAEVEVTGKKKKQKIYYHYSGYQGGLKALTFIQQMAKDPRKIIKRAVKNMLPKNKLRDRRMARLKVFPGSQHTYKDKLK